MHMPYFQCPLDRKKINQLFNLILILGIISLSIALAIYAYMGFFSRYWADDYCFSSLAKKFGLFNGLKQHYLTWSNRYTAFVLSVIGDWLGVLNIQLYPGTMILLLTAAITWNVKTFLEKFRLTNSILVHVFIGELAVFFILYEAPNLFQSLYWRSGMVSYFAPLLFLALINALILTQLNERILSPKKKRTFFIVSVAIVFFGMGLSETFASLLCGYLVAVGLFLLIKYQSIKNLPLFFYKILLTALIGGLIIIASPGNQTRMQYLSPATDLVMMLRLSLNNAWLILDQSVRGLILPNLFLFFIVFFLFFHLSAGEQRTNQRKEVICSIVLCFICTIWFLFCICIPTVYSMMSFPEPRALIIGRAIVILLLISLGGLWGVFIRMFMDKIVDACLLSVILMGLLVIIYPVRSTMKNLNDIPISRELAQRWDSRNAYILAAMDDGQEDIEITPMNSINGISEISSDPLDWVNRCAADFYGLKSIRAIDQP